MFAYNDVLSPKVASLTHAGDLGKRTQPYPQQLSTFSKIPHGKAFSVRVSNPATILPRRIWKKVFLAIGSFMVGFLVALQASAQAPLTIISPPAQTLEVSGIFSYWTIEGSGAVVNTNGPLTITGSPGLNAIQVSNGAVVNISHASTITSIDLNGVVASPTPFFTPATVTISDSNIIILGGVRPTGVGSEGTGTTVTLINTNVTNSGTVTGSTIPASGFPFPAGVEANDGGTITMTGGSITTHDPSSVGIVTISQGTISMTDVNITSAGVGIRAGEEANTISLTGSILTAGSGLAIEVRPIFGGDPADATLSFDSSRITGAMLTAQGSTSTVHLTNGTVWEMTGSSNATNLTNNGSTIDFAPPVGGVFKVLTTVNYVGAGGVLKLNTFLGGDDSPSDRLIINGTASGSSLVYVTNAGGPGAATTGNGIQIIQINGAGASGAFMQAERIAAGAYEYTLYRNGVGADSNDGNWYLRTVIPNPENPTAPEVPDYRVEVPLVTSIPPVAIEYGYSMLGTLHERVGDSLATRLAPVYEERFVRGKDGRRQVIRVEVKQTLDRDRWFAGAWGRLIGNRGFRDAGSFDRHGPRYDYTYAGIQTGLDVYGREQANGTLDKVGFYVGYGGISTNVKGAYTGNAGSIDTDAYTLGAYWTHLDARGWYTDAVIQSTWYSIDAKSIYGQKLRPDGYGLIASLEGGYSYDLGGGATIEPQVQLAYQTTAFDKVWDAYGRFKIDDGESLRGRIGVRLVKTWNAGLDTRPREIKLWVRANTWHEFMGDSTTTVTSLSGLNPVSVQSSLGGTWGELGVGVTAQVNDAMSMFATGAYNHSLDNKGRETWNGRLGMAMKW